jgi:hypothetical protein
MIIFPGTRTQEEEAHVDAHEAHTSMGGGRQPGLHHLVLFGFRSSDVVRIDLRLTGLT